MDHQTLDEFHAVARDMDERAADLTAIADAMRVLGLPIARDIFQHADAYHGAAKRVRRAASAAITEDVRRTEQSTANMIAGFLGQPEGEPTR